MNLRINPHAGVQAANVGTDKKPEMVSKEDTFEVSAAKGKELLTRERGGQPVFIEVANDKEADE